MLRFSFVLLIVLLMTSNSAWAQEPMRGIPAMKVPDGFTVELAAEPSLSSYPMFLSFDLEGNLFIAESNGSHLPGKELALAPQFMILRLTDTDQDGVYDTRTVFADELTLPMGVQWYQGSLYVASPPDFLRFKDTDGDGIADEREVILSGWNVLNTASLHGPFFAPDGWMYLTHGRHGYKIETKEGTTLEGPAAHIWRCKPDGSLLEPVASGGFDNPVELIFTEAGEPIGTMTYFTNPRNGQRDALMHWVEGGLYPKPHQVIDGAVRTGDLMPTMTKFARIAPAGLETYRAGNFGKSYTGNLFSAQFNPHRIQRHVLHRDGATFRTEDSDFLTSTDPDFHPTDVLQDADGSLLFIDTGGWYVEACPLSRVSKPDIRGGVYRIRKTGADSPEDPWGAKLDWASVEPDELIDRLGDLRPRVGDRSREALALRPDARQSLIAVLQRDRDTALRLQALWLLNRVGGDAASVSIRAVLSDPHPNVRVAAARLVGLARDAQARAALQALLAAPERAVRRQAATALGRIGDADSVPALLSASGQEMDRFEEHAIIYALIRINAANVTRAGLSDTGDSVRRASLIALDQMQDQTLTVADLQPFLANTDRLLRETGIWVAAHHTDWADDVVGWIRDQLGGGGAQPLEAEAMRDLVVAYAKNPAMQQLVADLLASPALGAEQMSYLLDTLAQAEPGDWPDPWTNALGAVLASDDEQLRYLPLSLIRARSLSAFDTQLSEFAEDSKTPLEYRVLAMDTLAPRAGKIPEAAYIALLQAIASEQPPALRQSAARTLAKVPLDPEQLNRLAEDVLPMADSLIFAALLQAFEGRADESVGNTLVRTLSSMPGKLHSLPNRHLETVLAEYPESVRKAATPLLAEAAAEEADRIAQLRTLEPLLLTGDVGRGRRVFFDTKAACYTCHAVGPEGGNLGPDLTTIGAIRSGHDILEAVLFPSASLVREYETYTIDTTWENHTGVIIEQTAESLLLATGINTTARIPLADITTMETSPLSIMPDGLTATLSQEQILDLMAFLLSLNDEQWLLPTRREASAQ
jgi:putative membrane-bound dehydrogenase-like protein